MIGGRRRWVLALAAALAIAMPPAKADPPAALGRGVNLTNWFRFPPSRAPLALRAYVGDAALTDLHAAGFTFVRLAVDPELLLRPDGTLDPDRVAPLTEAVRRIERARLAAIVELHPAHWQPDKVPADRAKLLSAWRGLAPALRGFDPTLTFPEILNEPVFQNDLAGWESLLGEAVAIVRAALPANAIVVAGNSWGGIDGLFALHPLADRHVIYSFHYYDPFAFTTLGEFQRGLDAATLAKLPFPVTDMHGCAAVAGAADPATANAVRAYCGMGWNAGMVRARIAAAAAWGRGHRVPVIAGEFGARARPDAAGRLAWLRAVREACEAEGIGWALWGYDDAYGLGVRRPPGARPALDATVLTALGLRPPF